MSLRISVVAPGAMGSMIAARLVKKGATVLTSLSGRSAATKARAAEAGMADASDAELAGADYFLSIVPPRDALVLAERMEGPLRAGGGRTVYVDLNATSVESARAIGRVVSRSGARYVDGCIIGPPGTLADEGPAVYLSGEAPGDVEALGRHGLRARSTGGPEGAASALKMAYGGLNKGITGLAAAMAVAAVRAGAARGFVEEMDESQPLLLTKLEHTLPDMYAKAYRWDYEMEEVGRFASALPGVGKLYEGMAAHFTHLGKDWAGPRTDIGDIEVFLAEVQAHRKRKKEA